MTIEALGAQISALDHRLTDLVGWVSRLDDRHRSALYGNGKPGLITDVERLKTSEVYRDQREQSRTRREWSLVVGVLLVLAERASSLL